MPAIDILPLGQDTLADAAELLAERHQRHRAAEPLLPAAPDARLHVERALEHEGARGLVAYRARRVVADRRLVSAGVRLSVHHRRPRDGGCGAVNLLSSRFWPARGFRPTFLRLARSIP